MKQSPPSCIGYFPEQTPAQSQEVSAASKPDHAAATHRRRASVPAPQRPLRTEKLTGAHSAAGSASHESACAPNTNHFSEESSAKSYPVPQTGFSVSGTSSSCHTADGHSASRTRHSQSPQPHPPQGVEHKAHINIVRLLALVTCIVVFCVCSFLLIRYAYHILISRNASARLGDVYTAAQSVTAEPSITPSPEVTATPQPTAAVMPAALPAASALPTNPPSAAQLWPSTYENNPTLRVSPIFYQLQAQNKDIIGWLKIDGLLEEAVVQRDNEYYLTHNALKQKSVTGALFLDEACNLDDVPTQMVIHGHNMKEGAMFGSLKKYKVKDASYYKEHPFIEFNTIYENGRYVIFSVAEVDIRSGRPDYLPFWHNTRFSSAEHFMEYVERAKLLSHYRCNIDVQPGDRLLTLSTCTGTDDNKRLIIMARKLRSNENELELNMSIYSTSDR